MFAENPVEIGKRIQSQRKKLGYTQDKLSKMTDISVPQISSFENGIRTPGLTNIAKIAQALNTTIDELYFGSYSFKPISSSKNKSELIVNCVAALFDEGVIRIIQKEEPDYSYGQEPRIIGEIGISEFRYELENFIEKLNDFEFNKENIDNPEIFKKQLLALTINRINNDLKKRK